MTHNIDEKLEQMEALVRPLERVAVAFSAGVRSMTSALQPPWMLWLNPVMGVIGAAFGATLEARKAPWHE